MITLTEVPFYNLKGRNLFLVINEKGQEWKGRFQGYHVTESCNWIMIFSNKKGVRDFTHKEKYFLFEPKKQFIQQTMEDRALHLILTQLTGDPLFTI
jgi:hypothetical protein